MDEWDQQLLQYNTICRKVVRKKLSMSLLATRSAPKEIHVNSDYLPFLPFIIYNKIYIASKERGPAAL